MDPDNHDPAGTDPSLVRPYIGNQGAQPTVPESDGSLPSGLRPYLLTRGRAGPVDGTLEIETQVAATPTGRASLDALVFEQRDIVGMCVTPMAIVEIAARLGLHLGVARVLVDDLVAAGHLAARRPETGIERSAPIIERVIRGLQAIR
jgi:Protein of unknown function (DUF742)